MSPKSNAHAKRGHVRAARAAFLARWLEGYGGYNLAYLQSDLEGYTRSELTQAVDDLVEDGYVVLEVGPTGIRVELTPGPLVEFADAAEAA